MSAPSRPEPIPLGPFFLRARIGRGGMGEVWRGVHGGQGVEVAVKVITGAFAREPHFIGAFRREVQTMAGLSHPGVIMVLDYGEVGQEAAARSQGALVAGSPYLAMEMASGGSLSQWMRKGLLSWVWVERVLTDMLDALGHAHARGVVHRDLKPGNALWNPALDRFQLTDFGIAAAADDQSRGGSVEQSLGTPSYMAPEQIRGRWRDHGPWTDLYALGCLAYEMACQRPPFRGADAAAIVGEHLCAVAPPLEPVIPVPEGFETWIHGLLRKRPEDRFQRAADAAFALASLGPPVGDVEAQPGPAVGRVRGQTREVVVEGGARTVGGPKGRQGASTQGLSEGGEVGESTGMEDAPIDTVLLALQGGGRGRSGDEPPIGMVASRAPLPPTWRRQRPGRRAAALVGAGLGLFGLRSMPMVGREVERDHLWGLLRAVQSERGVRGCVLTGPTGTGKSRLVRWLCERAHEVGAATVLKATCGEGMGVADGVPRMIARSMVSVGLDGEALLRRTERVLRRLGVDDPWQWEALSGLMAGRRERLAGPQARYAQVARYVELLGSDRPVIVWLDDVHLSVDALGLARYLLERLEGCPALLLLTVQQEEVAEREEVIAGLAAVMGEPGVTSMEVGLLKEGDQRRLVEGLLGLERSAATRVVERSGGNPLFAVQVVGQWIQRGVLCVGEGGFELIEGADVALPDDIHLMWSERVERLLEGQGAGARGALEVASALGQAVVLKEWVSACQKAGVMGTVALVDALVDRGLGRWTEDGWAFAHGMVRESVSRSCREAGRWASVHGACAAMLAEGEGDARRAERVGLHCFEAGALEASLRPLLDGAQERVDSAEYGMALALLDKQAEALAALGGGERAEAAEGWRQRARIMRVQGRFDEARAWGDKAVEVAARRGWRGVEALGLVEQAELMHRLGRVEEARVRFVEAARVFTDLGDEGGRDRTTLGLGAAAYRQGDMRQAEARYREAFKSFQARRDEAGVARTLRLLAEIAQADRQWERALELYGAALSHHQARGDRYEVAAILNGMAEIARFREDLDGAEAQYRQALEIMEAIGSSERDVTRINLALLLLARGRYAEARGNLEALKGRLERTGQRALLGGIHAELLPCVAAAQDWAAWDGHMAAASGMILDSGVADADDAWPAQLAGDLAAERGQRARAEAAWGLARGIWSALGRADRVAEIDARLGGGDV